MASGRRTGGSSALSFSSHAKQEIFFGSVTVLLEASVEWRVRLFQYAVVELFLAPVCSGLHEGQDDGMRILLCRRELRLE